MAAVITFVVSAAVSVAFAVAVAVAVAMVAAAAFAVAATAAAAVMVAVTAKLVVVVTAAAAASIDMLQLNCTLPIPPNQNLLASHPPGFPAPRWCLNHILIGRKNLGDDEFALDLGAISSFCVGGEDSMRWTDEVGGEGRGSGGGA